MIVKVLYWVAVALPLLGPAAQEAPAPGAAFDARLRHGQDAFDTGNLAKANEHARAALLFAPWDQDALDLALRSSDGDADARALWAYRSWGALVDEHGKAPKNSERTAALLDILPGIEGLGMARADAVKQLAKLVKAQRKRMERSPERGLVAEWAADLGRRLAADSPQLLSSQQDAFETQFEFGERAQRAVVKDLESSRLALHSRADYSLAVRVALVLRGLGAQGSDSDLQGDVPAGIDKLRRKANGALEESRHKLKALWADPLTVEQLEEMDAEESRLFSLEHEDPSNPGLALSPGERYRIETTCGQETLLGVASAVERHHARLVSWFGKDPFTADQGVIRVLPESAGLETEGAPFWWAGGFQSGSLTTARFTCSTIESFGRLLTHELTHRFDGAIYPGQPAWLVEGKAVWTGSSYESSNDLEFVANHVNFGTMEAAWIDGFGGVSKLKDLIVGELEDYRANYVAGYALYVFLKLYEEPGGKFLFAKRLEEFMKGASGQRKKPFAWFVKKFADGKQGRPEGIAAFAEMFTEFMAGFYWDDLADWTIRYESHLTHTPGELVYDTPTWSWARKRAEPYWGQDHAQAGGDLFSRLGRDEAAVGAYLWAWTVDERSSALARKLSMALVAVDKPEPAWVVSQPYAGVGAAPFDLSKVLAYAGQLRALTDRMNAASWDGAAAAFNADAAWIEQAIGTDSPAPAPIGALTRHRHTWDRPASLMGLSGWEESSLTAYDKRRAAGCWYVEADGDLHVGRFRPKDSTGSLDRRAHNRHAFARSNSPQAPGRYAISCKVQFTTSYVSGALVFGDTRRDRNIRLQFSAGDFLYSIGKSEQAEELEAVHWRVDGLRERDAALVGEHMGGHVKFDSPRTNFDLLAIVDGAAVHFWIEGQYLGAYHDALGIPIQGHVGFATSTGAIRVAEPKVQRLDRSKTAQLSLPHEGQWKAAPEPGVSAAFDLASPPLTLFRDQVDLPLRGMTPGPQGALVVWVPLEDWSPDLADFLSEDIEAQVLGVAKDLSAMLHLAGAETPLVFALPDRLAQPSFERLKAALPGVLEGVDASLVTYAWSEPSLDLDAEPTGAHRSWVFFVDSAGVLRVIERLNSFSRRLPGELLHWVTVFRGER